MSFLKTIGLGVVYVVLLPLFLVIIALAAVFGLFNIIYYGCKALVLFFSGRELFEPYAEDKKAQAILEASALSAIPGAQPSNVYVQQNYFQGHNGQAGAPLSASVPKMSGPANAPLESNDGQQPLDMPYEHPSLGRQKPEEVVAEIADDGDKDDQLSDQTEVTPFTMPVKPASLVDDKPKKHWWSLKK